MEDEYERFNSRSSSPFQGHEKSDLFVLAATYGWYLGERTALDGTYVLVGRSALSHRDEWLLNSIAVAETDDPAVLEDGSKVTTIAQEYANGGMHGLVSLREGPEDIVRELTTAMLKVDLDALEEYESGV